MNGIMNAAYNPLRLDYWFGERETRGLSLFRIIFGLLLLKDAIYHFPLSRIFYSDEGVLPLDVLATVARTNRFSLMDAMPAPWMASAFFVLWIAVLLNFIVGNRTTLMTILNFIIILSVHERNTFVLNGADTIMRVLSFWMMFLPLNHHYAVDAVRKRRHDYLYSRNITDLQAAPRQTGWAFVLRIVQIQIALVYIFASLTKIPTGVWLRGEALYYALQIEPILLPTGYWLYELAPPGILRALTWGAYLTEASWVFLVFLPVFQPTLRRIGLVLGVLFHTGIALTMAIPNFSMVMVASYLLFLDGDLLERLDTRLRGNRSPGKINLHSLSTVRWLAAALSRWDMVRVSVDPSRPETSAEEITGYLPFSRIWGGIALLIFPLLTRVPLDARKLPPPLNTPMVSADPSRFLRGIRRSAVGAIVTTAMFLVVWWNMSILDMGENITLVPPMEGAAHEVYQTSGLWQSWKLFAPYPSRVYGWIAVPGVFEDGTIYDLRTENPVGEHYARWVFGPNNRWRKYEDRSRQDRHEGLLKAWGSYYCQTYRERPPGEQLATLEIHYVWRRTPDPGEQVPEYETRVLWKHWCAPEYAY